MFGNRVGWGISALIVLAAVLLLWRVYRIGTDFTPPGPIGQSAALWTMQLPVDPRSIATWMTEDVDAIDLYKQVIAEYMANLAYDGYLRQASADPAVIQQINKGIDLMIRASTAKRPGVFIDRPSEIITYDSDRRPLKALKAMGDVGIRLGLILNNKDRPVYDATRARQVFQAVFSLGLKLYEERLVWEEADYGLKLMATSRYLDDPASPGRADLLQKFDDQRKPFYFKYIDPLLRHIFIANPDAKRFPQFRSWGGDMAALATKCPEYMWRVEAIFALGRCKFQGNTMGDQKGAVRLLKSLCEDSDPRIRIAAQAADRLTREDLQRLTYSSD